MSEIKKPWTERARWRIAYLMDRMPGQCWAETVEWALGYRRWPWARVDDRCRTDVARCGSCYCGKLRSPEAADRG
jgi:hypothetical protein